MNIRLGSWALLCVLASSTPAAAQATASDKKRFISAAVGVAVVEKTGTSVHLDAGQRVWKRLSIVLEASGYQNLVNRRELDRANLIADVVGGLAGQPVSSDVTVGVAYGGIGGRWTFDSLGRFTPYVQVTGGGVRGQIDPKFELAGTDITSTLDQFGVTLGEDLKAKFGSGAVTGTVGLTMERGSYFFQGTIRLLSFSVGGGRTSATSVAFGGGYRF
ncbi:MAG TPA: hypothetical protein VMM93_04660 [Vicinamibacterales bacterium]|nr:hypothetical protein [Vicinamibacterales bacterium]